MSCFDQRAFPPQKGHHFVFHVSYKLGDQLQQLFEHKLEKLLENLTAIEIVFAKGLLPRIVVGLCL
jgi:hypothetical protein